MGIFCFLCDKKRVCVWGGGGVCVCIGMRDRGGKTSDILFCLQKYLVMSVSLSKYESEKTEAQRGKELKVLLIEESCFNLISLIPKLNFPHMGYAMV